MAEPTRAEVMRVAALSGYFETMAGFGVDPRPLLREQGLTADMLTNPEQLIPARAAVALLQRSSEVTGCLTLGARMAEGRTMANLGATGLLLAHQPNLRAALETLREFRNRINSTLVLNFEEHEGEAILREDFSLSRPELTRQATDLAVGVLMRLCATLLGESWSPAAVCFSHEPPPPGELGIYTRLFRRRPDFNCEFNGLIIVSGDLDRPRARSAGDADEQLGRHARQLLEAAMTPGGSSAAEDADRTIRLLLPAGRASIQSCAAALGLTVRTFQRMLDAEGESFSAILNRTRMQLATQYLANPRLRVTDIADMLGYGSIGAFTRWHTSVFGRPPRRERGRTSAHTHGKPPGLL